MNIPFYQHFSEVNPEDFLPLLNSEAIRRHLIEHPLFDAESIRSWVADKLEIDAMPACRVRAITVDDQLAGWCGIQYESGLYEIAMVLDAKFWGLGRRVFLDTMGWAKELGHAEIYIHLLESRREYRFLLAMAQAVYHSELLGRKFTSYQLLVQ